MSTDDTFSFSRESTVRSVSLCLWAPRRGVVLAVHVGNFAEETAMFVCLEMNTGRLESIHGTSSWTPPAWVLSTSVKSPVFYPESALFLLFLCWAVSHSLLLYQIPDWVSEGPTEENAVCVNCQNNSLGDKCESCLGGYFLLQGKCEKWVTFKFKWLMNSHNLLELNVIIVMGYCLFLHLRCQCNGHADTCNEHDGTGCPCQNNTETPSCLSSPQSDRKDCYRQQVCWWERIL